MIDIIDHPIEFYVDGILNKPGFCFSRFGDGEWAAIFGDVGANCDGHDYSDALGKALEDCLTESPDYVVGMQAAAMRGRGTQIEEFISGRDITIDWAYSDVLHYASYRKNFGPMVEAMRVKNVLLVGPPAMSRILTKISFNELLMIEDKNCFDHYEDTRRDIITLMEKRSFEVIAFSASMMANVLIHDLHIKYPNLTMIDFGSVWDPYVGVQSRSLFRKDGWDDIIAHNLRSGSV